MHVREREERKRTHTQETECCAQLEVCVFVGERECVRQNIFGDQPRIKMVKSKQEVLGDRQRIKVVKRKQEAHITTFHTPAPR